MSDAPERIWAAGNGEGGDWGLHNGLCHTFGGIEYIRSDRIKALTAERDEANKRGDAWRFRADIAEVKLEKAVQALRSIAAQTKDVTPDLLNLDIAIHSVHSYANDILKDIV
jgi:hypothetical protein